MATVKYRSKDKLLSDKKSLNERGDAITDVMNDIPRKLAHASKEEKVKLLNMAHNKLSGTNGTISGAAKIEQDIHEDQQKLNEAANKSIKRDGTVIDEEARNQTIKSASEEYADIGKLADIISDLGFDDASFYKKARAYKIAAKNYAVNIEDGMQLNEKEEKKKPYKHSIYLDYDKLWLKHDPATPKDIKEAKELRRSKLIEEIETNRAHDTEPPPEEVIKMLKDLDAETNHETDLKSLLDGFGTVTSLGGIADVLNDR